MNGLHVYCGCTEHFTTMAAAKRHADATGHVLTVQGVIRPAASATIPVKAKPPKATYGPVPSRRLLRYIARRQAAAQA